ncbi:MAG TPA: hypothetical protein VKB34_14600 [Povalibacter sp.]|nr:hypothetical protein [Povalibacter sp.]
MARVFDSVNTFSSLQSQGGGNAAGRRQGICAALTGLWCMHMLEGKRDLLSKPSYERAQALQVLFRWDPAAGGQDFLNLLKRIGIRGTVKFNNSKTPIALGQIAVQPGVYALRQVGVHYVGACVTGSSFYFYDCDANGAGGLHVFDDSASWVAFVNQYYPGIAFQGFLTQ